MRCAGTGQSGPPRSVGSWQTITLLQSGWRDSLMCVNPSYVWHDPFMCSLETWPTFVLLQLCELWLTCIRDMTLLWLTCMRDMTLLHVWHDSVMSCVGPWPIFILLQSGESCRDSLTWAAWLLYMCDMTHSCFLWDHDQLSRYCNQVCRDSHTRVKCVKSLIRVFYGTVTSFHVTAIWCAVTYLHAWHDTLIFVIVLNHMFCGTVTDTLTHAYLRHIWGIFASHIHEKQIKVIIYNK